MLADEDHPLEDVTTSDRPGPQVLVVYRRRGVPWVLLPPLLLIAGVVGIVVYRKSAPPARPIVIAQAPALAEIEPPAAPVETPPQPVAIPEAKSVPEPAPAPVASVTVPETTPTPTPEPTPPAVVPTWPAPIAPPSPPVPPEEPVKRDIVGFDPEAAKVVASPVPADGPQLRDGRSPDEPSPPATPRAEGVRSEFQEEAEARHAERLRLEAAKPGLLEGNPRDDRARRQSIVAEARRDADRDRASFHADLRRLVAEKGYRAGRDIRDLFDTYGGREATIPEIQTAMARDLTGPSARLSTQGRIERMRRWGQPEHLILEDIQEVEASNRNGRGGPRTVDQSWVFAARVLLAYPPTKPVAATPARPVAR